MLNDQLCQIHHERLETSAIRNDDFSDCVQEEVLLSFLRVLDELEHSAEEVVRVSNRHISHANGGSKLDVFLRVVKQSLHGGENPRLRRKVNNLTVLTNREGANDQLI